MAVDALPAGVDPRPFELADLPDGGRVASNGTATMLVHVDGARVFRRRAIKTTASASPAQAALPLLNALAEQLLATPDMTAEEVQQRLAAIGQQVQPPPVQRIEWAVAEIGGLRVYFDGTNVIVTPEDLAP